MYSSPAGAQIWIDGELSNLTTPARIELTVGEHVVKVAAPDHVAEQREVSVGAGAEASIAFSLDATPAPAPATAALPVTTTAPKAPEPKVRTLWALRAHSPIQLDGIIDQGEWQEAIPAGEFTQKAPFNGEAPTESTTVRLLYDDDAIYVGFDCEQRTSPIIARLARRDRPTEADSVTVAFDSRGEGRSAFEFTVSAAATLVDGLRFDDGRIAREWDGIWVAKTQARSDGWSAELRIPLSMLRTKSDPDVAWGFEARRYISAKQETDEWAYIPREVGGEVSHYGRLEGLRRMPSSRSFELLPFVVARARHQSSDPSIVHQGWQFQGAGGVDYKWHPTGSVALTGTVLPDFGQVEADRLILNLTTIEAVFPEKRPFFLASMDEFATLLPIFYSRRIARTPTTPRLSTDADAHERLYDAPQPAPIYTALRLTADLSENWTASALSALTGANQFTVVLSDGTHQARLLEPVTSYSVLRLRSHVARGFDLGLTGTATVRNEPGDGWPNWLTSRAGYPSVAPSGAGSQAPTQRCPDGTLTPLGARCFHDAYVASLDLVWRSPSGDYAIRGQGYGSAIQSGPIRTLADGTRVGSGDLGAGGLLKLSKQGGTHWLVDGSVGAHGRKLDFNDLGYMDRQNFLRAGAYLEYRTLEPRRHLMETHTSLLVYGMNNLAGLPLWRGLLAMENLVLQSRWMLTVGAYGTAARFDDREVGDGTALERAALLGAVQAVTTDTRKVFVGTAQISEEKLTNGANFNAQLGVTYQPVSRTELSVLSTYSYNNGEPRFAGTGQTATDLIFGRLRADSAGVTVRAAVTFIPTLTLQTYGQAFLATGNYYDYAHTKLPTDGPGTRVRLRDLVPSAAPEIRPDFQRASLALNIVLRWEYRVGSTLYLLYVRSQNSSVTLEPTQAPRLDPNFIRSAPAMDTFMVKLTYWIG